MFKRTSSGLSNLHLFHGVDAVVYLEGGDTTWTKADAYMGCGTDHGLDIKFWRGLFFRFKNAKRYKFLALGSKHVVKSIAQDLVSGHVSNKHVHVCMDRDLEPFLDGLMKFEGVLYTFGYSWENDIWNADTIEKVLYAITPILESSSIRQDIDSILVKFRLEMYQIIGAEILLRRAGMDSLIGDTTGGLFDFAALRVASARVRKLISTARSVYRERVVNSQRFKYLVTLDCRGHIISFVAQTIIRQMHAKAVGSQPQAKAVVLDSLGINAFLDLLEDNGPSSDVYSHYSSQFSLI